MVGSQFLFHLSFNGLLSELFFGVSKVGRLKFHSGPYLLDNLWYVQLLGVWYMTLIFRLNYWVNVFVFIILESRMTVPIFQIPSPYYHRSFRSTLYLHNNRLKEFQQV